MGVPNVQHLSHCRSSASSWSRRIHGNPILGTKRYAPRPDLIGLRLEGPYLSYTSFERSKHPME